MEVSKIQSNVRENLLISPFFVFFLINASQTGVGMLGFQRDISKYAGYDAWIGIILSGLVLHIILFIMFQLLKNASNGDLISLHRDYFGKLIGNTLTILILVYFILLATTVFQTYIEILQVWVFSTIYPWEFTLIISIAIYYLVSSGFRVITGIAFWSTLIPIILVFVLIYTLKYSHFSNLLPIFSHSVKDILKSSKECTLSFLGFESMLFFLCFIRDSHKSKKWAHFGLLFTTLTYIVLTIITFAFYSQGQLNHVIWPTLVMTKIVQIPFIDRFEYFFIFSWLLVLLPPICLSLWSVTRGLKYVFNFKPTYSLLGVLLLINLSTIFLNERTTLQNIQKITSDMGLYILLLYIPALYIVVLIKNQFISKNETTKMK